MKCGLIFHIKTPEVVLNCALTAKQKNEKQSLQPEAEGGFVERKGGNLIMYKNAHTLHYFSHCISHIFFFPVVNEHD